MATRSRSLAASALPRSLSLSLVLLPVLAGCDEGGDDGMGEGMSDESGGDLAPTLSSLQSEVFAGSCALASCHSADTQTGQLVLEPGTSFGDLVDVPAVQAGAVEDGLARVVPGDPEASFLWIKLQPGVDPSYGALMPQGSTTGLDANELDAIREWIELGAMND